MARKCLVINLDRCIGCYSCELACKMENGVALGHHWNKLYQVEPYGEWPDVHTYWLSKQCQQCEDAPCVNICPTGASYRDEDGVVLVDESACIGCQLCMSACPYDVRDYNDELGVVQKCTLCKHLTQDSDEKPACVKNCPGKARFFGDLDDPESDPSVAIANAEEGCVYHLPDTGNAPRTAYILSSRFGDWRYEDLAPTVEKAQKYVTTEGSLDF